MKSFLSILESGNAKPESVIVPPGISVSEEKLSKALKDMKGGKFKLPSVLAYANTSPDYLDYLGSVTVAETIFLRFEEDEVSYVRDAFLIKSGDGWKITF